MNITRANLSLITDNVIPERVSLYFVFLYAQPNRYTQILISRQVPQIISADLVILEFSKKVAFEFLIFFGRS